jgi:hypothetical protein
LVGTDDYWVVVPPGINWYANAYFSKNDHIEYEGYMFKSIIAGTDTNRNNTPTTPDGDSNWERVYTKGDVGEINPWTSIGDYSLDEVVTYLARMYISLQNNNVNKQPDTEVIYWKLWPDSVAAITQHYARSDKWRGLSNTARTTITKPSEVLVNIDEVGYKYNSSSDIDLDTTTLWDNATYQTPANRAGKDFYIYATN